MNHRILIISICLLIIYNIASGQSGGISFSFNLQTAAKTSAGVFKQDGTLIRTLWNGLNYSAGNHTALWDGKLDNDSLAPDGSYQVKVISNNIQGQWGIIGNTSSAQTGQTVHHSANDITSMCFTGNYCYYSVGYNEGSAAHFKFNINNPQSKTEYLPGYGQTTFFEATDNIRVYHAGQGYELDLQGIPIPKQFIFATNVNNDSEYIFSAGASKPVLNARTYQSAIDITTSTILDNNPTSPIPECSIGGMAVQRNGTYIFASYYDVNEIHVLNKVTGALVQTITSFTAPKSLAVDASNNLWVCSGTNTVSKHTINNDGTLSAATLTLSGLVKPLSVTVGPNANIVAVADGSIKQQIRFFNNATGIESAPLGQDGGYATNPLVTNDKFMFKDTKEFHRGEHHTMIAFGLDGSLWVGDRGNYRVQHFSSNNTFIETILNIGFFYSALTDRNNPSRVFANYLEFSVDYSKPLLPNNDSWKLVKNWAYPIDESYDNQFNRLHDITTLGNGRTYALQPHNYSRNGQQISRWQLIELAASGNLRFTGIEPEFTHQPIDLNFAMNQDGSLLTISNSQLNSPAKWILRSISGFDGSNNPVWGADQIIASIPTVNLNDPITDNGIQTNQITSNKKIISYNRDVYYPATGRSAGYHLGAVGIGDNKWLWQTSPSTNTQYLGEFPSDGSFDIANGVIYGGSFAMAMDSIIVWGYHGEFWKGSQTNKWNFFLDNGLFLFQCGITGPEAKRLGESAPGMAGNSITGTLAKLPNGDMVLISNDEGQHGAVQVWKITGLNTISKQSIDIVKSGAPDSAKVNYVDLMEGLPFNGTLINGTHGWTRYPVSEVSDAYNETWNVKTNITTFKKADRDVSIVSFPESNGLIKWVKRDLGINTKLTHWKIDGQLSYRQGYETGDNFLDILDKNDRVIIRISRPVLNSPIMAIKANDSSIVEQELGTVYTVIGIPQPFSITIQGSNKITVAFSNYAPVTTSLFDSLADWQSPRTLRLQSYSGDRGGHQIDLANLKFYKNLNTNSINFRTKSSGNWADINSWQSSTDSISWDDAKIIPDTNAKNITILSGHKIVIADSAIVDELVIQNGGILEVTPLSYLKVNDGPGNDVTISPTGSLTIRSDSSGTGRIASSTGNIMGNVTVERYISSKDNASYRLLSSSVNTAGSSKPFIRDNWQEGQNNSNINNNTNSTPHYGIHITGSTTGANGFDASATGMPSMFILNQTDIVQTWMPVLNTNSTNLEAKKGYKVYIQSDRSNNLSNPSSFSNTTLRATGTPLIGIQNYTNLESNGRVSLITNPYISAINWNLVYNDTSTANAVNFENYFVYWDPNVGTHGGYVSVNSSGVTSLNSNSNLNIQSGEAFFVKAKLGISSPTFTIKESHKSSNSSVDNFRTISSEQLQTFLYFTASDSTPVIADGVNAIFDDMYSSVVNDGDAEEIANDEENIAIARSGKMLGIEGRPVIVAKDTLPLNVQRLKTKNYYWKFQPGGFSQSNIQAFLLDGFLNIRTPVSLSAITTIPFNVTTDAASSATDRFQIVFAPNETLAVTLKSIKAYQKNADIQVDWAVELETNINNYVVEKSINGRQFIESGNVKIKANSTSTNYYTWIDTDPKQGNNYYRIKIIEQSGSIKYSNVVNVKVSEVKRSFEVYPNPVAGNTLIVQFNNIPKGIYKIELINTTGQVIYLKLVPHAGGSASQTITIDQTFPPGSYIVQVKGTGLFFNKQILK